MRTNKLTPGSNLLWESSRMILPEHKERINDHWDEVRCSRRRERPVLDEQEAELIAAAIAESLTERVPVRLRRFDPYEDCVIEGIVERVDQAARRIKVDGEWFAIDDIIGVDRG